jgi:VRR-NUC domain/Fanconi anemia-associated nuclease SAP domain
MARAVQIEQLKSRGGRASLADPFYYLKNFETVIGSLGARYAELLSPEERRFIAHFGALPQAPRALLVRMVMRRGVFFRSSRLNYPEIGEIPAAVAPLIEAGWVEATPDLDLPQLQQLFTKAELLRLFPSSRPYRKLKKTDLVAVLRTQHPECKPLPAWCRDTSERVYHLTVGSLCERFRLMFFGNSRQDWREFVLSDLGIFSYESIPTGLQSRPFSTRGHIDAFEKLHRCREWLEAGLDLDIIRNAIPPPITDSDWLEDRRQKLLFQIARAYERQGNGRLASELFSICTHRGARVRVIRLRERAQDWQEARRLCLSVQENPATETERRQAVRTLPRLNRKLGICGSPRPEMPRVPEFEMVLDSPHGDYSVEHCVRNHLARQIQENTSVHYVENGLVNSLFGLLCWNAIFAPIPGAFFHDFQYGPADLSSGNFFERRHREFAECLDKLKSDEYKAAIRHSFAAKMGVQSPFVAWGLLSRPLLELALRCFPAAHLRLWFEWIARDVQANRAGFPDLVQFWPTERRYRLIEVKGPGDRLQDNQRRLLEFCAAHQMPVAVCYVSWAHSDEKNVLTAAKQNGATSVA